MNINAPRSYSNRFGMTDPDPIALSEDLVPHQPSGFFHFKLSRTIDIVGPFILAQSQGCHTMSSHTYFGTDGLWYAKTT
jgi:hypothetical protein